MVGDLDADVIAAYGRHLAMSGGRGGRPATPATVRVYLSMVRALARELGQEDAVGGVCVPRHEPGPPETLTDTDYANLLRVPDLRTIAGKRDYARLRVLGDCGLRSAELRGLRARDLRRPRANARHHRLYVCAGRAAASAKCPSPRRSSRHSRRGRRSTRSRAASACSTSSPLRRLLLEYGEDLASKAYLYADPFTQPRSLVRGAYTVSDPSFDERPAVELAEEFAWMRERVLQIGQALLGAGRPLIAAASYLACARSRSDGRWPCGAGEGSGRSFPRARLNFACRRSSCGRSSQKSRTRAWPLGPIMRLASETPQRPLCAIGNVSRGALRAFSQSVKS